MMTGNRALNEVNGRWLLQGVALKVGDHVTIDGLPWKVLGFGRSRNESQAPFLWIQNDRFGITVYFPADEEHRCTASKRSEEKAVA
jgi:hypothetical protein